MDPEVVVAVSGGASVELGPVEESFMGSVPACTLTPAPRAPGSSASSDKIAVSRSIISII